MRNIAILFFGFLVGLIAYGQTLSERLVLTDTEDSLYLNAREKVFDKNGNYCFIVKENGKYAFVTPHDKIGGYRFIGSTYGKDGEINYTCSDADPKDKPFYYKNANGTKVYGTAKGKIETYQTSNTRENVALVTSLNDSIYYYMNGRLLQQKAKDPKKYYGLEKDWVAFSENGNVIYFLFQDNSYNLYVNDRLIDRSTFSYTQLAINNEGAYTFAQGEKPAQKIDKYDYLFYVHSTDTVLGYVRTVWDYELKENGAYYYSGDDSGPYYIAINDLLYKNIKSVSNITLIDRNTFLYTFVQEGKRKINVNGNLLDCDFDEVFYPTLDKKGNFAYYGKKDYFLYKVVNGKQDPKPISKYGVRATPLYISPTGASLHYFKTEDSTVLFRDNQLVVPAISNSKNFFVQPYTEILPHARLRGQAENGNSLLYIEIDSVGYLVFNGEFSRPMIPMKKSFRREKETGEIVAGKFDDNGFFIIQKTGKNRFLININNTIFKEVEGVQEVLEQSCYFDGKELVFFGVKGLSFYQYTLTL